MTAVDRALARVESVRSLEDITTPWQMDTVELAKEVRRLRDVLSRIAAYPLHGEPDGGAYNMKVIALDATQPPAKD